MFTSAMPDLPKHTGTYEAYISEMVDFYINKRTPSDSILPLLHAVGARCVGRGETFFEVVDAETVGPSQLEEAVICAILRKALHSHLLWGANNVEDGVSVLAGFLLFDRWRACLKDIDSSYWLASITAHVLSIFEPNSATLYIGDDVGDIFQPGLCAMLNDWLLPAALFTRAPSMDDFTRAVFGDAWCDFARQVPRHDPARIISCIMEQRPMFVPGLAPAQTEMAALPLPYVDSPC
jgi:hypothetical protein